MTFIWNIVGNVAVVSFQVSLILSDFSYCLPSYQIPSGVIPHSQITNVNMNSIGRIGLDEMKWDDTMRPRSFNSRQHACTCWQQIGQQVCCKKEDYLVTMNLADVLFCNVLICLVKVGLEMRLLKFQLPECDELELPVIAYVMIWLHVRMTVSGKLTFTCSFL